MYLIQYSNCPDTCVMMPIDLRATSKGLGTLPCQCVVGAFWRVSYHWLVVLAFVSSRMATKAWWCSIPFFRTIVTWHELAISANAHGKQYICCEPREPSTKRDMMILSSPSPKLHQSGKSARFWPCKITWPSWEAQHRTNKGGSYKELPYAAEWLECEIRAYFTTSHFKIWSINFSPSKCATKIDDPRWQVL